MQANEGENKTERPMWAEKGGLDFEGRARWDAWTANKGMASDKAKLLFVKVGPSPVRCQPAQIFDLYRIDISAHNGLALGCTHHAAGGFPADNEPDIPLRLRSEACAAADVLGGCAEGFLQG